MSEPNIEDRTGQPREAREYAEARRIVTNRLTGMAWMKDPELMVYGTVILEALKIAEAFSGAFQPRRPAEDG